MENLVESAIHLVYFMRGAIQYEDVYDTTYYERKKMFDFINKRMEFEMKKSKETKGRLPPVY